MSSKKYAIQCCKEYLNSKNLGRYYSTTDFEFYYRKFKGASGNPYYIGISAADYIISNYTPAQIITEQTGTHLLTA